MATFKSYLPAGQREDQFVELVSKDRRATAILTRMQDQTAVNESQLRRVCYVLRKGSFQVTLSPEHIISAAIKDAPIDKLHEYIQSAMLWCYVKRGGKFAGVPDHALEYVVDKFEALLNWACDPARETQQPKRRWFPNRKWAGSSAVVKTDEKTTTESKRSLRLRSL